MQSNLDPSISNCGVSVDCCVVAAVAVTILIAVAILTDANNAGAKDNKWLIVEYMIDFNSYVRRKMLGEGGRDDEHAVLSMKVLK